MARITVIGGTGYAGSGVVKAAVARGHDVTSYSRHLPEQQIGGATYRTGSVLEEPVARAAVDGADVVVVALSPRADMAGHVSRAVEQLAGIAQETGVRLGVIGGAGSLHVAPGGPRILDGDVPPQYKPEMLEMARVLDNLRASDESLDWFYFSPAGGFGAFAPGETTGNLGLVILDEIERPAHRRARFTAAY